MGLSDLQSYIVQQIPDATEVVDLLKLSEPRRSSTSRDGVIRILIDGECCLDRLYGGYYPDWVCGGQWNKMDQFLSNFGTAVQNSKLDIAVFLNGSLETERLNEWCKRQEETYKFLQEIHQHIVMKRKPPPKIWWVPPAFLRSAIRLAFRSLNMKIMCSLEDHHKDIVRYMKKNHCHGIIADDSEYLIFEPSRYFSAQKLKLTFKGSLETLEMKLIKVFSTLNIPKDRFHIFATLLGNHIVPEKDLSAFYASLNIQELQQKSSVIEAVAQFVRSLDTTDRSRIVELVVGRSSTSESLGNLRENLNICLKYYGTTNTKNTRANKPGQTKTSKPKENQPIVSANGLNGGGGGDASDSIGTDTVMTSSHNAETVLPSDSQPLEVANVFEDGDGATIDEAGDTSAHPNVPRLINGNGGGGDAPGFDIAVGVSRPKEVPSTLTKLLYRVVPQIDNVAVNRHRGGLMSPYICQILKYKEVKLPVMIEDVTNSAELPPTHLLFRPLRQRVYAILFNLHHLHFLAKERNETIPKIEVRETYYDPTTKGPKTDIVRAVEVGWGIPTVERLWLGDGEECKRKRIRAFLSTMKSDKPTFLDSAIIPQHFLVLCCVLRYIISETRTLRQSELDSLITQALIQEMTDVNVAQDIEVSNLTMRGVHIAHMFMEGVEMALLVNDACGSPIPYMLFAPWLFFNGKIFNFVLEEQLSGKTIAEICGFKMEVVYHMDRLKAAILDGIKFQFAPNPYVGIPNVPAPLLNSYLQGQFGRVPAQFTQAFGPGNLRPNMQLQVRRSAGGLGGNPGIIRAPHLPLSATAGPSRNGNSNFGYQVPRVSRIPPRVDSIGRRIHPTRNAQLQVAGTVVGSWGANFGQPSTSRQFPPSAFHGMPPVDQVRRTPYGYPLEQSSSFPMDAVFRQLRISSDNKVPSRGHSATWNSRSRSQGKQQQHKLNATKNENGTGGRASTSTTKSKVSFSDEPHSIEPSLPHNGETSGTSD